MGSNSRQNHQSSLKRLATCLCVFTHLPSMFPVYKSFLSVYKCIFMMSISFYDALIDVHAIIDFVIQGQKIYFFMKNSKDRAHVFFLALLLGRLLLCLSLPWSVQIAQTISHPELRLSNYQAKFDHPRPLLKSLALW